MPRSIQNLLDQISNARYGEEVRSSIHDAIEACYDDVTAAQTLADAAATSANTAAGNADAATNRALAAVTDASNAAEAANEAADGANAITQQASSAATSATNAATNADTARVNANNAASAATNAASSATNAATSATTAATSATTAATNANAAATAANSAADAATNASQAASTAAEACDQVRSDAITATSNANSAASRANSAASMLENLTVTSEDVGPDETANAEYSVESGHSNIHFKLRQGAPGTPFKVIGRAYATLSDLQTAVPSPNVGDMYNVGSNPPYDIYRWTGSDWENQGSIGSASIEDLTNSEIDLLWNGTAISSSNGKYANHTGLLYLIVNKIKAAFNTKVDKVTGKGLSTNDFTSEYVNQIADHESRLGTLASGKVDKIAGKGLSTNDFTTANLNMLQQDNATLQNLSTTVSDLSTTVNDNVPISFTVLLQASSWASGSLTITDARFLASGYSYTICPNSTSFLSYSSAQIYADEVSTDGSIVFHCVKTPSLDLTVNVLRTVSA